MMRKTTLILLGATAGAAMTLFASQPHMTFAGTSAKAAVADTYRQLNLFGDVFERVRSDYVEVPDDSKLIESAINGMLAGLDPHSSYMDPKSFRDARILAYSNLARTSSKCTGPATFLFRGTILSLLR
jgi:carboxyl-terminal processing protease